MYTLCDTRVSDFTISQEDVGNVPDQEALLSPRRAQFYSSTPPVRDDFGGAEDGIRISTGWRAKFVSGAPKHDAMANNDRCALMSLVTLFRNDRMGAWSFFSQWFV